MIGEKNGLLYTFDRGRRQHTFTPIKLYDKDYNNFAPRLAFAYDVTGKGKTVIRGGWGLFYDAFSQDIFLGPPALELRLLSRSGLSRFRAARLATGGVTGGVLTPVRPCTRDTVQKEISSPPIRKCAPLIPRTST